MKILRNQVDAYRDYLYQIRHTWCEECRWMLELGLNEEQLKEMALKQSEDQLQKLDRALQEGLDIGGIVRYVAPVLDVVLSQVEQCQKQYYYFLVKDGRRKILYDADTMLARMRD